MNNKTKNSLDYSKAQLEQYSDDSFLEVLPERTDESSNSKYVLIKHDYFSSDSDHGRELLSVYIKRLVASSFNSITVYLTDKGVLLLNKDNPLYDDMCNLIDKAELLIADEESISHYDISIKDDSKIIVQSASSVAEDVIYISGLLILE